MPASLYTSEMRYRRLFEAAHDGILILDSPSGRIIDANPFLISFLGYTLKELLGKELYELGLVEDEAANLAAFKCLRTQGSIRYENLPLRTKDGRAVAVEFVSNLYREGDHQVIQCNIRDIGPRKAAEAAAHLTKLRLAEHAAEMEQVVKVRTAELRESNAQLETFIYSIAHDLRAPLRAMQGFAQILTEDYAPSLDAQGRAYMGYINTSAQTMDRLLTDLLEISRVSQQEFKLGPVPLGPAVAHALESCGAEIRASQARVTCAFPPVTVVAHDALLHQALVNLIANAAKFVSAHTPEIKIRTEAMSDETVRIWVEDNGIGIPLESRARIFEVFQRLHPSSYPGTGIGLAIVKKGVERMGGRVGVVSVPGKGSRFWIELPLAAQPIPAAVVSFSQ